MGSQLDTDSFSTNNDKMSYRETFNQVFPFYLSIGMTYELFYQSDVNLVKSYREAEKLRQKRVNEEAYIQGMYIYEGVYSIIYNTWCRDKNQKAMTYPSKPYSLFKEDIEKDEETKIKEEQAKAAVWMEQIASRFSKKNKQQEPSVM